MLFLKNMAGKTKKPPEELLTRAVDEVISKKNLEKKLNSGRKLRVKFGIDPTSPDIHLGHSVALRKLGAFQDLGHVAVLVIGDFTALIGDPSGRSESRKLLSPAEVKTNMKRYLLQAGKIIDLKKTEVRYNSEWYGEESPEFLCGIMSGVSLKQILEREDFKKRMGSDRELSVLEVIYPILQGYDSVRLKADVEIGGADQKLNLLMGRKMQRKHGQPEQDILMTLLIEGTDGKRKMSKSFGNCISLEDSAENMFGKIMSVSDGLMIKYFTSLTDESTKKIGKIEKEMRAGSVNPRDVKMELGEKIVGLYHGAKKAKEASDRFKAVFSKKDTAGLRSVSIKRNALLKEVLVKSGFVRSNSEAVRLIEAGGVELDGKKIKDRVYGFERGGVLRVGKKIFVKIEVK